MLITLASLSSCGNNKEITCEDVIKIYEEAGYSVFHSEQADQEVVDWIIGNNNYKKSEYMFNYKNYFISY